MITRKTLRSGRVRLELDREQVVPNDPGHGTPAMVCVGLRLKGFNFGRMMARLSGFAQRVPRALRGVFSRVHPAKAA